MAALRSAGIPAGFPVADKVISVATKTFDWLLPSFLVNIVEFSIESFYGCLRMNARFWWKRHLLSSTILVFNNKDLQSWESGEECLGCLLVVGSSKIQAELKLSVLIFLPKLAKLINITKRLGFCTVTRPAVVNKQRSRHFSPDNPIKTWPKWDH